jgi:hypothetical protein
VQFHRYFVSQSSEFCRHKPLYCFSTNVYFYKRTVSLRLGPETFGYTLVCRDFVQVDFRSVYVLGRRYMLQGQSISAVWHKTHGLGSAMWWMMTRASGQPSRVTGTSKTQSSCSAKTPTQCFRMSGGSPEHGTKFSAVARITRTGAFCFTSNKTQINVEVM